MNDDERQKDFEKLLNEAHIPLESLKVLSWRGIPQRSRHESWMLLSNYVPCNQVIRSSVLKRKRDEYNKYVQNYFYESKSSHVYNTEDKAPSLGVYTADDVAHKLGTSVDEVKIRRQLLKDLPRMGSNVPFVHDTAVQACVERILYIWAVRHPASGYAQGMSSFVIPFLVAFFAPYNCGPQGSTNGEVMPNDLEQNIISEVEADTYWCVSHLLTVIQDNYTPNQPGIQKQLSKMEKLVNRIDPELGRHLVNSGVAYMQFAYRWVHCLLLPEFGLPKSLRLIDTYLSEGDSFPTFHVYVCVALMARLSSQVMSLKDAPDISMLLQNPPLEQWTNRDMDELLSHAYQLQMMYEDSQGHLNT